MIEIEYWSASWCGPCKIMKPILNEIEASGIKVTRMDADEHRDLSIKRGIRGVPTMFIKKNGREVTRLVGAKDRTSLLNTIQQVQMSEQ